MSRNSKNATRLAQQREFSKVRKDGGRSASKTTATHGKRWTYRSNPEIAKRLAEMLGGSLPNEKTSTGKILRGAGSAGA